MDDYNILPIGTICNLIDKVDVTDGHLCTIKFIEQDNEGSLVYYYLRANDEELNNQMDPRFGTYWVMETNESEYLIPLSLPTNM